MSGYDAYLSFANYMKTQLASSGITVAIEKTEDLPTPYLIIQDGPDHIQGWLSSRMVQGWLVVSKKDTEPITNTMGEALGKVLRYSQDTGQLTKYDYSTDPETDIGTFIPTLFEVTGDFPGKDFAQVRKRVITWELRSNCKNKTI